MVAVRDHAHIHAFPRLLGQQSTDNALDSRVQMQLRLTQDKTVIHRRIPDLANRVTRHIGESP